MRRELAREGWAGWVHWAARTGAATPAESFDTGFVDLTGPVGRLGVLDAAVAPWHAPTEVHEALIGVLGALGGPGSGADGMRRAQHLLHDPHRVPRHANVVMSSAVCEIEWLVGEVNVVAAGDCEVWVERRGVWTPLVSGDMLEAQARREFDAAVAGVWEDDQRWDLQVALLDEPDRWRRPPLGLGELRLGLGVADAVDAVVVASDGARLNASRCDHLDEWLARGVHETVTPGEKTKTGPHPHGDYWVASLRRTD